MSSLYADTTDEWTATIVVPVHPFQKGQDPAILESKPSKHDICRFLGVNATEKQHADKLYFDRNGYPPPLVTDNRDAIVSKSRDLDVLIKAAAAKSGSPVVIGDSCTSSLKKFKRPYLCAQCNSNSSSHRKNKMMKRASDSGGTKRRLNTTLLKHECPFRFTIKADEHGFYISLWGSSGNPLHQGHPKIDRQGDHHDEVIHFDTEHDALREGSSKAYLNAGFNQLTNGLDELGCQKRIKQVEQFFNKLNDEIRNELRGRKEPESGHNATETASGFP